MALEQKKETIGHRVFIIQPYNSKSPSLDFALQENVALVESIPKWRVTGWTKVTFSRFYTKKYLAELPDCITKGSTAVMIAMTSIKHRRWIFENLKSNQKLFSRTDVIDILLSADSQNDIIEETTKSNVQLVPRIAIVGYTNAGKSSLILQLCQANSLNPVTPITSSMLCSTKSFTFFTGTRFFNFYDTIGFLSDIPDKINKRIIDRLLVVLKHCVGVVHVVDASNPAVNEHRAIVDKCLDIVCPTMLSSIRVNVINKVDLLSDDSPFQDGDIKISCKTKSGINELSTLLYDELLKHKVLLKKYVIAEQGSQQYFHLHKLSIITNHQLLEQENNTIVVECHFTDVNWNIFLNKFPSSITIS
ncbi:hypothetical protein GJ496_005234 [Pomphorhynchus laevis]|nr:hypothetical protein GJ496_005234 [Pomphorhynchus laevis]